MGHCAGQDVPRLEGVEVFLSAHLLGFGAGQAAEGPAFGVLLQAFDHKAGGPAHPRQHGDVPHRAGVRALGAGGKGHHAPHPAQVEPQLAVGVKGQGGGLQDLPAGDGGAQLGDAQAGSVAVIAFGPKCLHHLSFLFLQFSCMMAAGALAAPTASICKIFVC